MPKYNVGLAASGVLAFIIYLILGLWILPAEAKFEVTFFSVIFQFISYVVMMGIANVLYLMGPFLEIFVEPAHPERFRRIFFGMGFWLSVALPFSIPLLLALGWRDLLAD